MRDDLIARAEALENDEDAWTWLDHDPDVAYRDPDSYHGKIVALAEEAGWERCYHRDGAKLHFNVKLRGPGIYRGLNDTIASFGRDDETREDLERLARHANDSHLYGWWEDIGYELAGVVLDDPGGLHEPIRNIYQCGRSGGYLNARSLETDPVALVKVGLYLAGEVEYYDSAEYGAELAHEALEIHDQNMMAELASPRSAIPYQ